MMEIYINDIFNIFNIEKTQLNINVVKSIIVAMISKKLCTENKQKIKFDSSIFILLWEIYLNSLEHFDPNYNRKTDFSLFFKKIINSLYNNDKLEFHALFCPGYTQYGYKDHLGNTTLWKLKELLDIKKTFGNFGLIPEVICYYSDVFLENCNYALEKNWPEQLKMNRNLFHKEANKYFESCCVKNMSDIELFSHGYDIEGFVDKKIISEISKTTYNAFKKSNERFYKKMGFSEEQIQFRNDRLITMYKMFSNYLNEKSNAVFLPMENMYERENIFSENKTCVMYLKLKR